MRVLLPGVLAALLALPAMSLAQSPPPASEPPPPALTEQAPPAVGQDSAAPRRERRRREGRAPNPKRAECRQSGQDQGLRGPDLGLHVQICVLEARIACLKQAAGQKLRGRERADFLRQCQAA